MRNAALTLPPLRRLYDFAMYHAKAHEDCRNEIDILRARHASEKEVLDLQLYVMRSDQQRAAVRNESLSAALCELKAQASDYAEQTDLCVRMFERVNSPHVTIEDLNLLYSKVAGRLTMISSEISALRPERAAGTHEAVDLYLNLLESSLTGVLFEDAAVDPWTPRFDPDVRAIGRDWPKTAATMIGTARLRNLRVLAERVLADGVAGDMLEAGVWRGGACILLRGLLAARGIKDRAVWVADSFAGLPPPDPNYPADQGDIHSTFDVLAVSLEAVQSNFQRYGLLDEQVKFLKGWFADTLPGAPIEKLAILRLDGDMYSSTIQTLDALYSKVSIGGFIIVDDYILKGCREAIHDFRQREAIQDEMLDVDGAAVYWRKGR